MVDSGIRTHHLWLPNRGEPDTCIIQDNNSADLNSARHGQFQEKEKNADYWIEYFPFFTENKKSQKSRNIDCTKRWWGRLFGMVQKHGHCELTKLRDSERQEPKMLKWPHDNTRQKG